MNDFNIDDPVIRQVSMASLAGVEEPVEEIPPFTPAQISFIEKMIKETISHLALAVDVTEENSYSWHSNNEYFRIEVSLNYKHPDGPYEGERISEASDSLTVHIPSTSSNDY